MGGNILFLSVLCLLIFETTAVNMCTNQSSSGKDVSLNLNKGTGVSGCNCSVKLTKPDNIGSIRSKIIFETVQFSGCKYKLVISYNNTNSIMSCSNNNSVYYDINKSDEIKLYLEPTNSQDETTIFEVNITSSVTGDLIRLECFLQTESTQETTIAPPTTSTSTSPQTSTSPPTKTSPDVSTSSSSSVSTKESTPTTTLTPTSAQESMSTSSSSSVSTKESTTTLTPTSAQESMSTSSSSSVSMTGTTPKSVTPTVTQISNKPTSGNDINETKTGGVTKPGGDDIDIGIIGGAVGGGLLLIILIIIIIICVVKKRRKKNREKRDYSRPTVTGSQHDYTDIDLGAKGNNSSRQSDNTDQNTNSPVEN